MKLSGELPLTSFFSLADRSKNPRRENLRSATERLSLKRKGVNALGDLDDTLPKKHRRESVLRHNLKSGNSRSTETLRAGTQQRLAFKPGKKITRQPDCRPLTLQAFPPVVPAPEVIDISDDEDEDNHAIAYHVCPSKGMIATRDELEVFDTAVSCMKRSFSQQTLQTPPATNRPPRKTLPPSAASSSAFRDEPVVFPSDVSIPLQTPGSLIHLPARHQSCITYIFPSRRPHTPVSINARATRPGPSNSPPSTFSPMLRRSVPQENNSGLEISQNGSLSPPVDSFQGNTLVQELERKSNEADNIFTDPVLSQTIIPSSQTQDILLPYLSSRVVLSATPTENSPIFKVPDLPIDSNLDFMAPEEMFVPSSQTQCMSVSVTSPCLGRYKRQLVRLDTIKLNDHLGDHAAPILGEIVQSSQSQLERGLSISRGLSPISSRRSTTTEDLETPDNRSSIAYVVFLPIYPQT